MFGGNFTLHYLLVLFEFIPCATLLGRFTLKLMKLKFWGPSLAWALHKAPRGALITYLRGHMCL